MAHSGDPSSLTLDAWAQIAGGGAPVANYYALIARAVATAGDDASRRLAYDRARALQLAQFRKIEPPLTDAEIKRERSALEDAIRRVEHEVVGRAPFIHDPGPPLVGNSSAGSRRQMGFMLGVIALQTIFLAWLLAVPIPTTSELDSDLVQIRDEIKQASIESDKYAPSAMKTLIEARKQTLLNTEAMLSQKRDSILRRIDLYFMINGTQLDPASNNELDGIKQEIDKAKSKLTQSVKEANQYTGGLVQSMALMTAATDEVTLSQLQLKFYSAKYGLPFFFPHGDATTTQPSPAPGNVVKDRDAL